MSCISMSVGLGNVWRFPFTAYENGGGAFLLPYLLVLVLIGRPLYLLELGLGQFCSGGCIRVWELAPGFKGVGYGQVLATACVLSYYCSLIALALRFLVDCFSAELPWTICDSSLQLPGQECIPSGANRGNSSSTNLTLVTSAEQYFKAGVLKESGDMLGMPDPALSLCLVSCWVLLYFSLARGVSGSGKVAYFTAIFPYMVMLLLLVRGLTLPGALKGLKFFFTPSWSRLLDPGVWYAALTQSFFSLGVGFGQVSTYSSYNRFHHDSYKDALIISVADTFTSLLAGTIIFSILGHLSFELGVPITQVVKSGAGLAFVSYPEVIAKFDTLFPLAPQVFGVLFFLMLITLGFGSALGLASNVITALQDSWPSASRRLVTMMVSISGVLLGLLYLTPGGQGLLELVDYYGGSLLVIILTLVEIMVVAWLYGAQNILKDLSIMLGTHLGHYWKVCWEFIIPSFLVFVLSYFLYSHTPVSYNGSPLPWPAQAAGLALTVTGATLVPLVLGVSLLKRGWGVLRPSMGWGPREVEDREEWERNRVQQDRKVDTVVMAEEGRVRVDLLETEILMNHLSEDFGEDFDLPCCTIQEGDNGKAVEDDISIKPDS
jgi:solute carrier family 6 amino acid transporter-like protein 5/7/9/14